ncbi:BTAD domain-containing putative transcriptional regulator [Actinoplanes sp. NBRC 101535]|uniref:AfsR/SARP family transcriptional regulator n=1 Tax=Actinoplanes sp. NBRC 101535 TaxID=3032196 RepID=UPI0024A3399A|nr:BTAD domain-containing putative transcriptional regulator [Actinoplanes sp. NBRC 101535]GLY02292.1 hypothetical protein Acsp01_26710 [Actinoplanes sp. NBRC 101535]
MKTERPVWFSVLGPVQAWRDGREIDLGAPQQRALLALLLVNAGRPVSLADIVDAMWGECPPDSAVNSVHRNIGTLRRILEPGLAVRDVGRWLVRSAGGYRMDVDAGTLDLLRFRVLADRARQEEPWAAARLLAEALLLWRGGMDVEWSRHAVSVALDREYLATARCAADAALAGDAADEVLPALEQAARRGLLDEALQARLVLLLAAAGRQADALEAFGRVRERLSEDLGISPGPELVAARDAVLRRHGAPERSPAAGSVLRPAHPQCCCSCRGAGHTRWATARPVSSGTPAWSVPAWPAPAGR